MTRNLLSAFILALTATLPANAEQFAVRLGAAYVGATTNLTEVLTISEIESFSDDGAHYVVLEAPNEAYVEAFIYAVGLEAIELNVLEANWFNPTMANLSISQRLGFFRSVQCVFCTG